MSGKGKQAVRKSGGKPSVKQTSLKGKEGNKPKETSATTSACTVTSSSPLTSPTASTADTPDSKELALSFPLIKTSDNGRVLPRYTAILSRTEEEGVCMEDLDMLQLELEALLSAAALRIRALKGEVGALNQTEDKKDKKSKSSSGKPLSPGKRGSSKSQDERSVKKAKDNSGKAIDVTQPPLPLKFTKVKSLPPTPAFQPSTSALPDLDIIDAPLSDIPVAVTPKNDTPNKFWASVEPYCSEISTADVQVLKDLVQAHESVSSNLSIPPLGKHYSLTWLQEEVNDEAVASAGDKKKRDMPEATALIKKVEKTRSETTAAGPLTQRLVCALMEENLMPAKDSIDDKDTKDGENITPSRMNLSNGLSLANAANLELRVRKELQEQGLLDLEDVPREGDDEVLTELKKCQDELKRVNQHNIQALNRLLSLSNEEMARQELRRKLNVIDMQVVDAYKKIMVAKQKKKPLSKKEKEPAWKALKERDAIIRQLEAAGGAYAQK